MLAIRTRQASLYLALGLAACGGVVTTDGGAGASTGTTTTTSTTTTTTSTSGAGGAGGVLCNPNGVVCATAPPTCAPGEVASVVGDCWGPCVPILSCATEPSCSDCSGGFCAAYVAFTVAYRCVLPSVQCAALACSCLAQYLCATPFDACVDGAGGADVSCECPTC